MHNPHTHSCVLYNLASQQAQLITPSTSHQDVSDVLALCLIGNAYASGTRAIMLSSGFALNPARDAYERLDFTIHEAMQDGTYDLCDTQIAGAGQIAAAVAEILPRILADAKQG